jgi:hypothetical protein
MKRIDFGAELPVQSWLLTNSLNIGAVQAAFDVQQEL